ncbi:helix-turn-helix transcriptional regulator [Brucella sp. 6810]|uniref:helix-turn-helix domain-containing protein n=1 Tax=Brucella sp. 6810 TaxID=2769351 RepID=UPI00165CA636|nr:helix-turn-helix transcriptional regulator [Brucella sp. 6810]
MAPITKPKPVLGKTYLTEWREFRGLNQSQAAEAANVSRTLLSKMENGHSPYLQQHIEALANLYGCSPAELIGRDPKSPFAPIRGDEAIIAMLSRIEGLDQRGVEVAFSVIDTVIKRQPSTPEQSSSDDQSEQTTDHHRVKP